MRSTFEVAMDGATGVVDEAQERPPAIVDRGDPPVFEPAAGNDANTPSTLIELRPKAEENARTVPYGALAEERARRKELQRELRESVQSQQRLQGRLETLQELAARSAPQEPTRDLEQTQIESTAFSSESAQTDLGFSWHADTLGADGAFRTQVLQSVRSYAVERPDFIDAYQHARQARVEELTALGCAQDEALAITFDNEREVINSAFAAGRNPAQVIYDFAVGRGYQPPSLSSRVAGAGQGPVPRPIGGVAPMTEAQKIALAARGQAAAKSLSAAGGGSTGTLTLEALAGMSDEEFAEATKGDRWQKLLLRG